MPIPCCTLRCHGRTRHPALRCNFAAALKWADSTSTTTFPLAGNFLEVVDRRPSLLLFSGCCTKLLSELTSSCACTHTHIYFYVIYFTRIKLNFSLEEACENITSSLPPDFATSVAQDTLCCAVRKAPLNFRVDFVLQSSELA